jgi:hypothetical protein
MNENDNELYELWGQDQSLRDKILIAKDCPIPVGLNERIKLTSNKRSTFSLPLVASLFIGATLCAILIKTSILTVDPNINSLVVENELHEIAMEFLSDGELDNFIEDII